MQKGARGKMSVLILAYKRQDKQGLGSQSATGAGSGKAGCLRNGLLMTGTILKQIRVCRAKRRSIPSIISDLPRDRGPKRSWRRCRWGSKIKQYVHSHWSPIRAFSTGHFSLNRGVGPKVSKASQKGRQLSSFNGLYTSRGK